MEKERIEKIYQMLIYGVELTKKNLQSYGFTEEELKELEERKILTYINKGKYQLNRLDDFRKYGVKLLQAQNFKDANKCFIRCYQIAPNSKSVCLQRMLAEIKHFNYEEAFKIYQNLEQIQPEKSSHDNNLYLYLLNIITTLPEEYQKKASNIGTKEIMHPYSIATKAENDIRGAILQGKYIHAHHQLIKLYDGKKEYSVKYELIKALLAQVIQIDKIFKERLLNLAKSEQYEEITKILLKKQTQINLSKLETNVLLTSDAITKMLQTKIIPVPTIFDTFDIVTALIGNNFSLAEELNDRFMDLISSNKENDLVSILLTKANQIIRQLEELNTNIQESSIQIDTISKEPSVISTLTSSEKELTHEINYEEELQEMEQFASYISSENMPIDATCKKIGLLPEQILLIKIIYIRDYYIESNYIAGDKLYQEVFNSHHKTKKIISLLNTLKEKRETYKDLLDTHKKTLRPNHH